MYTLEDLKSDEVKLGYTSKTVPKNDKNTKVNTSIQNNKQSSKYTLDDLKRDEQKILPTKQKNITPTTNKTISKNKQFKQVNTPARPSQVPDNVKAPTYDTMGYGKLTDKKPKKTVVQNIPSQPKKLNVKVELKDVTDRMNDYPLKKIERAIGINTPIESKVVFYKDWEGKTIPAYAKTMDNKNYGIYDQFGNLINDNIPKNKIIEVTTPMQKQTADFYFRAELDRIIPEIMEAQEEFKKQSTVKQFLDKAAAASRKTIFGEDIAYNQEFSPSNFEAKNKIVGTVGDIIGTMAGYGLTPPGENVSLLTLSNKAGNATMKTVLPKVIQEKAASKALGSGFKNAAKVTGARAATGAVEGAASMPLLSLTDAKKQGLSAKETAKKVATEAAAGAIFGAGVNNIVPGVSKGIEKLKSVPAIDKGLNKINKGIEKIKPTTKVTEVPTLPEGIKSDVYTPKQRPMPTIKQEVKLDVKPKAKVINKTVKSKQIVPKQKVKLKVNEIPQKSIKESIPNQFKGENTERLKRSGINPLPVRERIRPQATNKTYKFKDTEVEKVYQQNKGVKNETINKIKQGIKETYNRATRPIGTLEVSGENAELYKELTRLPKLKSITSDDAVRVLDDITKDLDNKSFDLFSRKVLLDDFKAEAEAGNKLPNKFTPKMVNEELKRLDSVLDDNVKTAITNRANHWETVKNDYVKAFKEIGIDMSEKLNKKNYFRHQVLEHMENKKIVGNGKQVKSIPKRGFNKQRTGEYEGNINTDYLQAEYEVLAQMKHDTEYAKALKNIDKNYNIMKSLKNDSSKLNKQSIEALIKKELDADTAKQLSEGVAKIKPKSELKTKLGKMNSYIAMSFDTLKNNADNLWKGDKGEYSKIVENIKNGVKSTDEEGSIFKYLTKLMERKELGSKEAATIFKYSQEKTKFIKETLGKGFKTWEDIVPEGYTTYSLDKFNKMFKDKGINEDVKKILQDNNIEAEALNNPKVQAALDELNKVLNRNSERLVVGKRKEWVVKQEIADTLDNLTNEKASNAVSKLSEYTQNQWKQWVLTRNPYTVTKYNIRNFVGDIDAVLAGNPTTIKKIPKSSQELMDAVKNGKFTPELKGFYDRGGFQSLLYSQEISKVNVLEPFERFHKKTLGKTLAKPFKKYTDITSGITNYREMISRYATYLDYIEQMKANGGLPKNYGASKPEVIRGLKTIEDRAFKLQNDLLGAYDEVSELGKTVRKHLIPFWSWNEVNFKRYSQLIKNVGDVNPGMAKLMKVKKISGKAAKLIIGSMGLSVAVDTWNKLKYPDLEETLPDDVKAKPHIILGKDSDGNTRYFSRLGSLNDYLEWFGLSGDIKEEAKAVMNGDVTLQDQIKAMAQKPINKLASGVSPFIKTPFEVAFKKKSYPNVFEPSSIKDTPKYIADTIGLGTEFSKVTGRPTKPYSQRIKDILTYTNDPKESSYWNMIDKKNRFEEKTKGKGSASTVLSEKSLALYNYKLAIRYKDDKAAKKYHKKYMDLGGSNKGLKQSFNTMNPLYGLKGSAKRMFIDSLSESDKKKLELAIEYYDELLALEKSYR